MFRKINPNQRFFSRELTTTTLFNPTKLRQQQVLASTKVGDKSVSIENRVRVRIWTSKSPLGKDTYVVKGALKGNVGHATLETNKIYASIWPRESLSYPALSSPPHFMTTPEQDMHSESIDRINPKDADYVFNFYSLNTDLINDMFNKIKKSDTGYHLLGEEGYSCSTLTMALLEHGGLQNIISYHKRLLVSPTQKVFATPNNLVRQLILAEILERNKYPEVKEFDKLDDAAIKEPKSAYLVSMIDRRMEVFKMDGVMQSPEIKTNDNTETTTPRPK